MGNTLRWVNIFKGRHSLGQIWTGFLGYVLQFYLIHSKSGGIQTSNDDSSDATSRRSFLGLSKWNRDLSTTDCHPNMFRPSDYCHFPSFISHRLHFAPNPSHSAQTLMKSEIKAVTCQFRISCALAGDRTRHQRHC